MPEIRLYTIGFTRKSAEEFFTALQKAGVKRLIDIRLHNVSQLAGFAKRDDLEYFLKTICAIAYLHRPDFAPTQGLLEGYRKKSISWEAFEKEFGAVMKQRRIEESIDVGALDQACLLCSEPTAGRCHRRLVAEYLRDKFGNITICHL